MPDIKLPEGMSASEFEKLFGTFMKQRVSTAARDKAVRTATKQLVDAHKAEYDKLLAAVMPKDA